MVGGNNRIVSDTERVMYLLENYKQLKRAARLTETENAEITALDKCMSVLETYERDLIQKTVIEGVSIRAYSINSCFSRTFVTKRRKEIIEEVTKYFKLIN